MVQEQEEEKEAVHEIEKTQQIELEKFVDQTYSRADEAPVPWSAESLSNYNLAQAQFFHLSNFHLYKRRPIAFPDSIMLSRNFFNPKWTGHRRIKNIVITLEWIPDVTTLKELPHPLVDYNAIESAEKHRVMAGTVQLLQELAKDTSSNYAVTVADGRQVIGLALSEDIPEANWGSALVKLGYGNADKLSTQQLLHILDSNVLREEQSGRYTVAVSLAEAESLRRIIHVRKTLNQPAFWPGTNTAIRLNILPANNIGLDYTSNFVEPNTNFQRHRAMQCLRFVDGDLNYSEKEISLLLRSIFPASVRQRQEFFLQMLSCRRRARQSWDRATVSLAFHLETPLDLVFQRVLGLALNKGFVNANIHIADAFAAINHSNSGQLAADELWGAVRYVGLSSVTAENVLDFVHVADTHHTGRVYYTDFLFMLTGQREIEDDERDDSTHKIQPIEPYGLQELDAALAKRELEKRNVDSEANKEMAAEEQRVRGEIERETMLEELNVIQRSKNPVLDIEEGSLTFNFNSREQPNLASFFATIKNGTGPETAVPTDEFGTKYWNFTESSTALLNMRSVQFITNANVAKDGTSKKAAEKPVSADADAEKEEDADDITKRVLKPLLERYMITLEYQVPSVKQTVRKKAWKNGVLKYAEREADERLRIALFDTNLYKFGDRHKLDRAGRRNDEDDEDEDGEEEYDEYDEYGGQDDSDASSVNTEDRCRWMSADQKAQFIAGREAARVKKLSKFVYKKPDTAEENRIYNLRARSVVQEKVGHRTSTTIGDNQLEWIEIFKPVSGFVIIQQGGYSNWERHKIVFETDQYGSIRAVSDFGQVLSVADELKSRYNVTTFAPIRALTNAGAGAADSAFDPWGDDDDDFGGGFDFSWFGNEEGRNYDEDEGSDYSGSGEEGEEEVDEDGNPIEKDNGNVDTDIAHLMEAVKAAHGMKAGDLVQRNPETWVDGNNDGGAGNVGRVVNVKNNGQTIDVVWPNGRSHSYNAGANHKFPVIKVGHEAVQEVTTTRETYNIDRFEAYLQVKKTLTCGACGVPCNTETVGWFACNRCASSFNLCFTCFAGNQHAHHEFTNVTELAEVLRLQKVVIGTCVRPTGKDLQELRSEKSYGIVNDINTSAGVVTVSFPEEEDLQDAKWKIKGLTIVDVKSEKYATTWMGMLMNIGAVNKDPKRSVMGCVMNQFFAPAIVDTKYKIGASVYALIPHLGQYMVCQVASCLPGGLYCITISNGRQYDKIPESSIAPALFSIGDRVRYNNNPAIGHFSGNGVAANVVAEVVQVQLHTLTSGYLTIKVPKGMGRVTINADFSECFLIGDGKWYIDIPTINPAIGTKTETTEALPAADATAATVTAATAKPAEKETRLLLPKSAQAVIDRNFKQGNTHADIYLRQVGSVPGTEGTYRIDFATNTIFTTNKEGSTEPPVEVSKVIRDPPLPWVLQATKGSVDDGKWHVTSIIIRDGDEEGLAFVDGKKVDFVGVGYGFSDDEDDEDGDEESEETEESGEESGEDDNGSGEDEVGSEDADIKPVKKDKKKKAADSEDNGSDGSWETDEGEENAEEAEGDEEAEEKGEDEESDEDDGRFHSCEATHADMDLPKKSGEDDVESDSSSEDESAEVEGSKKEGAAEATSGAEAEAPKKEGEEELKKELKTLPKLRLTAQEILALDVRNPVSIAHFDAETMPNTISIFGPDYPSRNVSSMRLHWGNSATPEIAKTVFERLDKACQWECKKCGTFNSRLLDACRTCNTERVEDASAKVNKRAKIRVAHHQSKEVTDLRSRMHARLKAQMQKQLDELEDMNNML
eukprot:GILJ01011596.1.p1 GENE.GILJ01011596.1~~GILJ01011596.1.p1  ORF type:complete len:2102 (+),score=514.71 GILJ01011596.1:908-6307(+)